MDTHNFSKKREAQFINPPNILKAKVGFGGVSEELLERAQSIINSNKIDFQPLADMYISAIKKGIEMAEASNGAYESEYVVSNMLFPAVQLKGNGSMFHYQLVTDIASDLVEFLEVIEKPDRDVIEVVTAYQRALSAVISGNMRGDGGDQGKALKKALSDACERYFSKFPEYKIERDHTDSF